MSRLTIAELKNMRESEDHVEFKKGEHGNVSYNGADKQQPKDRRRCILGYVTALCNEKGGHLVIGMEDKYPHNVVGTSQCVNAVGQLESDIYRDTGIRPDVYELYEEAPNGSKKRVLVISVPSRPVGKVFKFEDVPLMRVGEELKPMDDKTYLSIIQEQEPDFSEMICRGVRFEDLDEAAIERLKEKYAIKQKNPSFRSLSNRQALSDLKLIDGYAVTNSAVLLVGKEEVIGRIFPQAKVMLEYRSSESQINFDRRVSFSKPFFLLIDELWNAINERNGSVPVRDGAYIFDIPFFNEEVIREVVNNAFAHRDYRINSEIVVKLYPHKLVVQNAGGFPKGVSLDNLLTVASTPRNRLLADVLSKTGIVERSGQGMDKIFLYTLSEGKPEPNYTQSDDFSVTVILSGSVKNTGFAMYVQSIQQELPDDGKLSVFDVLALCEVRDGMKCPKDRTVTEKLVRLGYLEKHGKTNAVYYILPRRYYEMTGNLAEYSDITDWDANQVLAVLAPYLLKYGKAKKAEIMKIVGEHLSEKQLRKYIDSLLDKGMLRKEGERGNTTYYIGNNYIRQANILNEALKIGLSQMQKDGKIR
ncbi:MAG: putative DNA binding domain-containing protein [Bacteroidetes bacterium]|uniref:DNA binding domain-containing protein n=2 Tax=Candidatus Cryptobacteroides TaxID=2840523 RepID=A0A940DRD3_9BACT|nr:putative DNA binding domain-containing protein [Candidatus Cryptobacteroides avicola]